MERKRKVLVAPLDWGLGHATRCIPVIRALLKRNADVIIAGSGASAALLKNEFPHLKHYALPGYAPRYAANLANSSMVWAMGRQLPGFIKTIYAEHSIINELVKKEQVNVVISDNRYGCHSQYATSVFITHQAHILMPQGFKWMEPTVNYFNRRQVARFDTCWIPAPNGELLGHMLPGRMPRNHRFIGYLSRFNKMPTETKYDVVVVASGPEPQRKMLVDILQRQLKQSPLDVFMVKGIVRGQEKIHVAGSFTEANYLSSEKLGLLMQQADIVIARPGYSTVMDLARVGGKAIFIPTPGQTEQAYLASQLMQKGIAFSMSQSTFDLTTAIKESDKFGGFTNFAADESLLEQAIQSIL